MIFANYLTWIILLPVIGALAVYAIPGKNARWAALLFSAATFVLTLVVYFGILNSGSGSGFGDITHLQYYLDVPWINFQVGSVSLKIDYAVGVDGLSLPLVVLNAFLTMLAVIGGWER